HAALARDAGDRPVHQPRIDEGETQLLGHPPPHRGLPGPRGAIDGDDHPTVALSESTSAGRSRRTPPGRSRPRWIGPKAVRRSSLTGWPTASNIRRTCRLRPSLTTILTWARPPRAATTSTVAGCVRP